MVIERVNIADLSIDKLLCCYFNEGNQSYMM